MIKKFVQFNESIKHLLVGPSEDEVWDKIKDLSWPDLLLKSSKNGILKGVKLAVKKGTNIHYMSDEPLWWVIHNNYFEVAKYLIENKAHINVDDGYPIKHACEIGDLDMVKFLLEQGADPHLRDGVYVKYAKQKGYDDIVQLLYEWT